MRRRSASIYSSLLAVLFLSTVSLYGRDFHDPYATIDPVQTLSEGAPGAVMDWEYTYQAFRGSDLDDFQLNMVGAAGLLRAGGAEEPRFALGMRYGAYLLTGPGGEDIGTPHLAWRMNSVQFQYGIHAAYVLTPRMRLLTEYSRLSDHPLGGHPDYALSDVAYDRIAAGVGFPDLPLGPEGTVSASIRIAYIDLWDGWDAQGTDTSRVQWNMRTGLLAVHRLPLPIIAEHNPQAFVELHPDVFTQHDAAGIDATLSARIGIRLADTRTSRAVDAYLDTYVSRDTERVVGETFPVALLGLGVRIGNASRP